MGEADEYDFDDDGELPLCPKCDGDGIVNCYCGGDFCVCENYGEKSCGLCHGEGEVSEERAAAYLKHEREMMQALAEAFKKDKEADPAPTPPHGKDER